MERAPAFERAALEVKKLTKDPSNEDKLKLYALFKVAHGTNIDEAKRPGAFDFQGKYKLNAWKEMVDSGLAPEDAQKQYVEFVEELKPKYAYDPKKTPEGR